MSNLFIPIKRSVYVCVCVCACVCMHVLSSVKMYVLCNFLLTLDDLSKTNGTREELLAKDMSYNLSYSQSGPVSGAPSLFLYLCTYSGI